MTTSALYSAEVQEKKANRCLRANVEEDTEAAKDSRGRTGAQRKGTEECSDRRYQTDRSIGDSAAEKRSCWRYIPSAACWRLQSEKDEGLLPCGMRIQLYLSKARQ